MAKKKANKQSSTYWLVPAVLTVLVGCALMWYWWKADMKSVEMEEESVVAPSSAPADAMMDDEKADVKNDTTTSEEIDAMFKKLDTSSTASDDLSDLK